MPGHGPTGGSAIFRPECLNDHPVFDQPLNGRSADELDAVVQLADFQSQQRVAGTFRDGPMQFEVEPLAGVRKLRVIGRFARIGGSEAGKIIRGQLATSQTNGFQFECPPYLKQMNHIARGHPANLR